MKKYTLEHNLGETSFDTLMDAIKSMYIINCYSNDSNIDFEESQSEINHISHIVEDGKTYNNGDFSLFISEG